MTHECGCCGQKFGFKVELAVHIEQSGHRQPVAVACPVVAPSPVADVVEEKASAGAARSFNKPGRRLLAAAALVSLLGFNCLVNASMRCYTHWQVSSHSFLVQP